MSSYSLTICLTLFRGTGLDFTLSYFPVLGGGIGWYVCLNCSGGNMMYSLTLFCRTGLGFTLSHFPVLGGGVSFFCWFINNLINCPLVSFLRFFFSISILYGLVFKPLLLISILYGLVLKPLLLISILCGLVFKPLLGRVAMFISILYGLVFKPFLGRVAISIYIV